MGALAFAGRKFPDATLRGKRRFRSHGGTAPAVSGCSLSSEASMPSSVALCRERRAGQGADTPAMVTFASAPDRRGRPQLLAGRLPRLTGLTSYLSGCFCVCSWVTWFFTPPQFRNVYELCQARSFPADSLPLRALICERSEPFGGVDPPGNASTCWCYCSSHNPLGNSISMRIETIPRPDSVRARFLNSRLTAQFLIRV